MKTNNPIQAVSFFFIRRRFFIQGPSAPPVRPIVGTMPLSPGDNNVERLNVFPSGLA